MSQLWGLAVQELRVVCADTAAFKEAWDAVRTSLKEAKEDGDDEKAEEEV